MNDSLLDLSYATLLDGAREVSPSVRYDEKGYAPQWNENLMQGLPLEMIGNDFTKGAGHELEGKLRAAHSSAALVVNTFGPWRIAVSPLSLGGITGFRSIHFEASCATGLGGTPPNLDLLAEGDLPVAVASKCTEWIHSKAADFSSSYDDLQPSHGHSPWFNEMQELRKDRTRYKFLDSAQLIKHAFGLMSCYRKQEVRLIYAYWEPRNAIIWPECRKHRDEAAQLAAKVAQSNVRLVPKSYRELWSEWEAKGSSDHLKYLRTRYDRDA